MFVEYFYPGFRPTEPRHQPQPVLVLMLCSAHSFLRSFVKHTFLPGLPTDGAPTPASDCPRTSTRTPSPLRLPSSNTPLAIFTQQLLKLLTVRKTSDEHTEESVSISHRLQQLQQSPARVIFFFGLPSFGFTHSTTSRRRRIHSVSLLILFPHHRQMHPILFFPLPPTDRPTTDKAVIPPNISLNPYITGSREALF